MGLEISDKCHEHSHGCHPYPIKCFSWTAVLAGALVGVGLSFLLNLFNVAIGLTIFNTSTEGLRTLAVGGFVGMLIGVIVSMFLAGMAAGYLGRPYNSKQNLGILYGFVTWCLALVLTIFITSYLGRYVSSFSNSIAHPTMVIMTTDEETLPAHQKNSAKIMSVNAEKTTNALGLTTFIIFAFFFISAFSTCAGACCGMSCKEKEEISPRMPE